MKKQVLPILLILFLGAGNTEAKTHPKQAEAKKSESTAPAPDAPSCQAAPNEEIKPAKEESRTEDNQSPGSTPLQGSVEDQELLPQKQAMPAPVEPLPQPVLPVGKRRAPLSDKDKNPLQGSTSENALNGQIDDGSLKPLEPRMAPEPTVLQGSASLQDGKLNQSDPDIDDQELQIEWDRWRNRFLRAVQLGVQENVNNPEPDEYTRPRVDPMTGYILPRFPLGTSAWFSCQITADRRIRNLNLIKSSGFPNYDTAVIRAVKALEGTSILRYPAGSHRTTVTQEAGIKTAESADFRYYKFGDVERYRSPQQ